MSSSDIERMSRRRFSKVMAGIGLTGASFSSITQAALADAGIDIENEKPVLKGYVHDNHEEVVNGEVKPRRKPVYYGVPIDQWTRVESARDAAAILREELGDLGIGVGVGNTTRGQQEKLAVVVRYPVGESPQGTFQPSIEFESLTDKVPAGMSGIAGRGTPASTQVDGIPVTIRKEEATLDSKFDCNYRPVPAGCAWRTEEGNSCTMGAPVYDNKYGVDALVSAAHCFLSYDAQYCYQNNNHISDKIGEVNDVRVEYENPPKLFDAAVIDITGSANVSQRTADWNCDEVRGSVITGTISEQHLHYMNDNNESLTKQGIAKGVNSGPVEYVDDTMFKADINRDGGDSGGPYWIEGSHGGADLRLIAGIHRGGDTYAQGTQMVEIEDRFNVVV